MNIDIRHPEINEAPIPQVFHRYNTKGLSYNFV